MNNITPTQAAFFNALRDIQETAVIKALSDCGGKASEDALYNATYEAICGIMELIDGYYSDELKLDLIEKQRKISVKGNLELHDACADYIKYEK